MSKITFYKNVLDIDMPFIRIEEGDFKGKIFLIDTGSSNNMLFESTCQQMKDSLIPEEGTYQQFGIDGCWKELNHLERGKLTVCGKNYGALFLIVDDQPRKLLEAEMGFPVCGIIGMPLMAEHNWVIDFGKQEITFPDYGL